MKRGILQFIKDPDNKTVRVKRTFLAPPATVWRAWTEPELLDQWWAPRPYKNVTKHMDFKEGGYWLYHMESPEGQIHWCRADYRDVQTGLSYRAFDAFCDENGLATDFPNMDWHNSFYPDGEDTLVEIVITFKSKEALLKTVEMGFEQGFTMALENLDEVLANQ